MLLPPEVAKGMTVFPLKSYASMKVLIIVGQVYHQIGKPTYHFCIMLITKWLGLKNDIMILNALKKVLCLFRW
jgi:hypothetical protein